MSSIKSSFGPIRFPTKAPLTGSDINRVQDEIDAAFKKLATDASNATPSSSSSSSGVGKLTSADGSVTLTPGTGTGASVDLSVPGTAASQIVVVATTSGVLTIPGLNGDADGDYEINGKLINPIGGGDWFIIRPNNDVASNYGGQGAIGSGIIVGNDDTGVTCVFHMFMTSKSGQQRYFFGGSVRQGGGSPVAPVSAVWFDDTSNITSLAFTDDSGAGHVGAGSYVRLRKLGNQY